MSSATSKSLQGKVVPIEDQIRQRAYEIYLRRGGHEGSDQDDWIQAEQELLHTADETSLSRAEAEGFIARK